MKNWLLFVFSFVGVGLYYFDPATPLQSGIYAAVVFVYLFTAAILAWILCLDVYFWIKKRKMK